MKVDLISRSLTYTSSVQVRGGQGCVSVCASVCVIKTRQLTPKSLNQPGHFYCQHNTNSNAEAICFHGKLSNKQLLNLFIHINMLLLLLYINMK